MNWGSGRVRVLEAQLAAQKQHADGQERLFNLASQRLREENLKRIAAERAFDRVAELTRPLVTRWVTDPEGLQERYLEIRKAVEDHAQGV